MGWYLEATRPGALAMHPQLFENRIPAINGHDAPRQRQHITPVTVGMKQRLEQRIVAFAQRALQLSEPTLGDRQIGFSSGKHGVRLVLSGYITFAPGKSHVASASAVLRATPVARIVLPRVLEEN
jgi:hypothetical protein